MVNLNKFQNRATKRQDNLNVILDTMLSQLKQVSDILSDTKVQSGYKSTVPVEYQDFSGDKHYFYLKVVVGKVVLVNKFDNVVVSLYDVLTDNKFEFTLKHFDLLTLVEAWKDFVDNHLSKLNTLKKAKSILLDDDTDTTDNDNDNDDNDDNTMSLEDFLLQQAGGPIEDVEEAREEL